MGVSARRLGATVLVLVVAVIAAALVSTPTADAQTSLKMPFRATETWVDSRGGGYHGTAAGWSGYDLAPTGHSNLEVLAVASGVATLNCALPGGQAFIFLDVPGVGRFKYAHVDANDALSRFGSEGGSRNVRQGDVIGRLSRLGTASAPHTQTKCPGVSRGPHLHFVPPYAGIVLDGQALGRCPNRTCSYKSTNPLPAANASTPTPSTPAQPAAAPTAQPAPVVTTPAVTLTVAPTAPGAPGKPVCALGSDGSITVTWAAAPTNGAAIADYQIRSRQAKGVSAWQSNGQLRARSYAASAQATTLEFQVRPLSVAGLGKESPWSSRCTTRPAATSTASTSTASASTSASTSASPAPVDYSNWRAYG